MIAEDLKSSPRDLPTNPFVSPEDPLPTFGLYVLRQFTTLARRKWLFVGVTGIAMVAGVITSYLLPVRYTSTTRIMTPQQTQSSASILMSQVNAGQGLAAAAGAGALGLKNPNDLYVGLLTSRPISDAIIQKLQLAAVYKSKDMTAARMTLAENTKVVSEKSGLLAISVTDEDKSRASAIANSYTGQLRTLTKTIALTESSQRRMFYEEQLKSAKDALVSAEASFQEVESRKGMIHLDAQARALVANLAPLRAQIEAKRVELSASLTYSTDKNPDVQLIQSQLASLQREEATLEQRDNQLQPSDGMGLKNVAGAGLDYLRAQREIQYRQTLYDLFIKQYDAAKLDEAKDAAVVQVVEAAIPADRQSAPKRASVVLIFTLLGALAACIYVLGRELLETSPEHRRFVHGFALALRHGVPRFAKK